MHCHLALAVAVGCALGCATKPPPVAPGPSNEAAVAPEGVAVRSGPTVRLLPAKTLLASGGHTLSHDGPFDADWLEAKLKALKSERANDSELVIEASRGVTFQDVISAMDVAVRIGWIDVAYETQIESGARATSDADPSPEMLKRAPVVIVTRTDITLAGTVVVSVADALAGDGLLDALTRALPTAHDGISILQADASTDAHVINRVIETCKHAGLGNVLFAVKSKS